MRDRQRRLGAGLPRHGRRHREADAPPSARAVPHHLIDILDPHRGLLGGALPRRRARARCARSTRAAAPAPRGRHDALLQRAARRPRRRCPRPMPPCARRSRREARSARLAGVARGARARRSGDRRAPRAERRAAHPARARSATRDRAAALGAAAAARGRDCRPLAQIALVPADRAALHARIAERFDAHAGAGLVEEVRAVAAPLSRSHAALPAMRAVGYRQAWEKLEGETIARRCATRGIAATRQLAKRQLTWLRATPGVTELNWASRPICRRAQATLSRALRCSTREDASRLPGPGARHRLDRHQPVGSTRSTTGSTLARPGNRFWPALNAYGTRARAARDRRARRSSGSSACTGSGSPIWSSARPPAPTS